METEKRLFVGGLFSNVKEADLREKFSRYGTIQHVEIRKKKEIDGKTDKTFAYINIHTTEGKMKTCIGVFNNTSWKGSKMTIQCAKEDFMKRLKEERRNGFCAPNINDERNISFRNPLEDIESVREFHMKGAVPGTPVTESKEWVVGKYGRVLPVVNLRGKDKRKITKIDPSKYCHNLKKVDGDVPEAGRDLTWEIRTNETDIVKRRKGEFPNWQPPIKKQRSIEDKNLHKKFEDSSLKKNEDQINDVEDMEIIASGTITLPGNRNYHSDSSDSESDYESMKSSLSGRKKMLIPPTDDLARKKNHQQRNLMQSNATSTNAKYKRNNSKDQNEDVHIPPSLSLQGGSTKKMEIHNLSLNTLDMDSEGDKSLSDRESVSSVDTDEIVVRSRKLQKSNAGRVVLTAASLHMNEFYSGSVDDIDIFNDSDDGDDEDDFDDDDSNIDFLDNDEDLDALAKKIEIEHKHKFSSKGDQNSLPNVHTATKSRTVSRINIAEEKVKDDQHVHQTDIMSSRKVVMSSNIGSDESSRKQNTASEDYESDSAASSANTDEIVLKSQTTQKTNEEMLHHDESLSEFYGAVSDLMDENENSSEDESSGSESDLPDTESDLRILAYKIETEYKQNLKRVPCYDYNQEKLENRINQTENKKGLSGNKNVEKSISPEGNNESKTGDGGVCDDDDDDNDNDNDNDDEEDKKAYVHADVEKKQHSQMTKEDETLHGGIKKFRGTKHLFCTKHETAADKKYSPEANKTSQIICTASSSYSEHTKESLISTKPPKELCKSDQDKGNEKEMVSAKFDERLKQESNEKRLASLRQRQKEVKIQQEKIKTALANVDNSITQNKKIVFDSESESEVESEKREIDQSNILFNEDSKKTTETAKKPALFSESSESDSEDKDSDQERFRIRPEYEGTSGKKLMYLQSKVGKDERFKLDERFLDSEDEEETDEQKVLPEVPEEGEKLKSLQILQEVVGRPLNIVSKNPAKKKIFRDMSMLRYDPSRDDHVQFEIKPLKTEVKTPALPEMKKEKKKKKDKSKVESADEAEPLPEVSKDRYFEVSTTFTDIFGKKTDEKQQSQTGFSFMSMF